MDDEVKAFFQVANTQSINKKDFNGWGGKIRRITNYVSLHMNNLAQKLCSSVGKRPKENPQARRGSCPTEHCNF